MVSILEVGAIVAGIIGIVAYIPQILHLIKVKDSSGISLYAWGSWLVGNILLLIYAISIRNVAYAVDYILFCLANTTIIILTVKYKK